MIKVYSKGIKQRTAACPRVNGLDLAANIVFLFLSLQHKSQGKQALQQPVLQRWNSKGPARELNNHHYRDKRNWCIVKGNKYKVQQLRMWLTSSLTTVIMTGNSKRPKVSMLTLNPKGGAVESRRSRG